jgi:hypothetical protein
MKFMDMERDEVLDLLQWNDRNGCWTDDRAASEELTPTSFNDVREVVLGWLHDDPTFDLDAFIDRFREETR